MHGRAGAPARRSCSMARGCIAGIWGPRDGRAGQSARPGRSVAARVALARRRRRPHCLAGRLTDFVRRAQSASAHGSRSRSARDGWCRGSQSRSAAASSIYFAVDHEPALWAAVLAPRCGRGGGRSVAAPAVRVSAWRWALLPLAAGFATATVKRAIIAHPVLSAPAWNVEVAGFVEMPRRARALRPHRRARRAHRRRRGLSEQLERVRVSVRKGTAPRGRQLRRVQGAAVAAARAVAARRL